MATSDSSTPAVSLKLLIDSKKTKVLFAEAGKDFVDFLFGLLALPVSTIISLLPDHSGILGCFSELYQSLEDLSDTYVQPHLSKETLLKPKTATTLGIAVHDILNLYSANDESKSKAKCFYMCSSCTHRTSVYSRLYYVADYPGAICPRCRAKISGQVTYVAPPEPPAMEETSGKRGFVKGVVTYMVMDDLKVKPIPAMSTVDVLNNFKVKNVGALKEKVVHLSMDKGMELLKELLQSKSVLTNVFLGKKGIGKGRGQGPKKRKRTR